MLFEIRIVFVSTHKRHQATAIYQRAERRTRQLTTMQDVTLEQVLSAAWVAEEDSWADARLGEVIDLLRQHMAM
jgi:hypothetical protein